MQFKKLALSVAVVLAAPTSAFAWNPTTFTPGADFVYRMSGATASDTLIRNFVSQAICDSAAGPIDTLSGSNNGYGIACIARAGLPFAATGQRVLFLKHGAGGSGSGVQPLLGATTPTLGAVHTAPVAIPFIDPLLCTGAGPYTCTSTVNVVADGGISDVEPGLFRGTNRVAGYAYDVTTAIVNEYFQNATIKVRGVSGEAFGIIASTNLYNCLNAAQGNPAGGPTISQSLAQSLFRGGITNWNNVRVGPGATGTGLLDRCFALGQARPTDTGVKIVRRVPGSGTNAVFNRDVMEAPCNTAASSFPAKLGNVDALNGSGVAQGSGSGDVERGMQAWNTGTTQVINTDIGTGTYTVNAAARTGFAIGFMGVGRPANANWRFVKFNGEAPSVVSAHDGKYPMWAEATIQYRVDAFAPPAAQQSFAEFMKTTMGTSARINAINTALAPNPPAYLALSTITGNTPDVVWSNANPVIGFTHTTAGATGTTDNCRVATWNTAFSTRPPLSDDTF